MWGNTDMVLMTSRVAIVATSSCGVIRHYKEKKGNTHVPATLPAQNGVHCTRSELLLWFNIAGIHVSVIVTNHA